MGQEKRRAKVRKAEGKSQESGGQKSGKRRAKARKAEGKSQESGGQRPGKRRAKQRQTFCLTLQVCADDYCAETAVLCCHAGHWNRRSWRLCAIRLCVTTSKSFSLPLQWAQVYDAKTASLWCNGWCQDCKSMMLLLQVSEAVQACGTVT